MNVCDTQQNTNKINDVWLLVLFGIVLLKNLSLTQQEEISLTTRQKQQVARGSVEREREICQR